MQFGGCPGCEVWWQNSIQFNTRKFGFKPQLMSHMAIISTSQAQTFRKPWNQALC